MSRIETRELSNGTLTMNFGGAIKQSVHGVETIPLDEAVSNIYGESFKRVHVTYSFDFSWQYGQVFDFVRNLIPYLYGWSFGYDDNDEIEVEYTLINFNDERIISYVDPDRCFLRGKKDVFSFSFVIEQLGADPVFSEREITSLLAVFVAQYELALHYIEVGESSFDYTQTFFGLFLSQVDSSRNLLQKRVQELEMEEYYYCHQERHILVRYTDDVLPPTLVFGSLEAVLSEIMGTVVCIPFDTDEDAQAAYVLAMEDYEKVCNQ